MIYRMLSIWLTLLVVTAEGSTEPPPRGRLCIGDAKTSITEATCSDTSAATIAVKPADRHRRFFWLSGDARTAYAGTVAPKAESIVLDPKAFSALDTVIDGDVTHGWPLDVNLSFAIGPESQWTFKLDGREAKRLQRLYVPPGTYRLTANAEHHLTYRARVVAGAQPSKLNVHFLPLALARGVVVDSEDKPIAQASIAFPDETLCTTVNEQGAFTCELPEEIPESLVVSSKGYASRDVPIRREVLTQIADLGRVRLSIGHILTLKIVRPEPSPARVSLFLDAPRYEHPKLKSIAITEREETVHFDAAEGEHFVVVEGDGPLERLEVPVKVKDADTEEEIRITPFQLAGSVRFGDAPLAEGLVEIIAREHNWREQLPLKDGVFGATMWQDGVVGGWVNGPELAAGELFYSPKLGEDPSRWDIRIEKRLIVGRVFDNATKAPVPDAHIEVVADTGDSQSYFPAGVQPDGSYRILAHKAGTYTLRVESPKHMPYSVELRISAEDRARTHDIALEQGVLQPIDVVIPAGVGIPGVSVLEGVQPDRVNPEFMSRTDERGHYELRGLPGQSRLIYFVPRQGSFAVARVAMPRTSQDAKPLQVVVPPPSCALRVRSVGSDGEPVPAGILIRYNGEFVRPAILRFVTGDMGWTGRAGEALLPRLPAGSYEVWAITGDEDEVRLIASGGTSREPVRVGLSGGEQVVTVVASPR
jgi:hypothetical protein